MEIYNIVSNIKNSKVEFILSDLPNACAVLFKSLFINVRIYMTNYCTSKLEVQ